MEDNVQQFIAVDDGKWNVKYIYVDENNVRHDEISFSVLADLRVSAKWVYSHLVAIKENNTDIIDENYTTPTAL